MTAAMLPAGRALVKALHTSAFTRYPRTVGKKSSALKLIGRTTVHRPEKIEPFITEGDEDLDIDEFNEIDETAYEHLILHEKKRILTYLRLIERDGPLLRRHRRPFVRPTSSTPVVVRAISYSGEYHPVLRKRVIVVPVSQLPLTSPEARHKFKVLVGPRWSELPPRDSGIGREEHEATGLDGYVKISCEEFPEAEMNLKWTLDVLKRLIAEAHNTADSLQDIPLDKRHLLAKARKAGQGEHVRARLGPPPSIRDFPKEWLPPISK